MKHVRKHITIPVELEHRIEALKKKGLEINVSAAASSGIESKVRRLEKMTGKEGS